MASFEQRGASVRVTVRVPGEGRIRSTFDTMDQAKAWADRMERRKEGGELKAANIRTVEDLLTTFLDLVASKTDTARWNRFRIVNWCQQPIAKRKVGSVTTHDMNVWASERTLAVSGSTVNRELTLWSAAFNYGVKALRWIDTNPVLGVTRQADNPARNRPLLTPEEIQALRQAGGYDDDVDLVTYQARVIAAFLLALETGMRSGEILRLRPMHYDAAKSTVVVAAMERGGRKGARSGRAQRTAARTVPLTAFAREVIERLIQTMPKDQKPRDGMAQPPYIVGLDDTQRDAIWRKVRDRAGIADLHFHDTKHEACTRLSKHVDVLTLSHAIGTKDLRLLRDVYYQNDAAEVAAKLPPQLASPATD